MSRLGSKIPYLKPFSPATGRLTPLIYRGTCEPNGFKCPRDVDQTKMVTAASAIGEARRQGLNETQAGKNARLIMHSDGLGTRWSLDNYPGLLTGIPV